MNFSDVLEHSGEFARVIEKLNKEKSMVHVRGLSESAKACFMAAVIHERNPFSSLVIAADDFEAQNIYGDLRFFMGENVLFFPSKDYVFYHAYARDNSAQRERLLAEYLLLQGNKTVVCSASALLQFTIPPAILKQSILSMKVGESYSLDTLTEQLVYMGYERVEVVEGIGQFSLRGGILDVFSPSFELPYRVEFFDDEVDSIRVFDPEDQLSTQKIDMCVVIPCRELLYTKEEAKKTANLIQKTLKSHPILEEHTHSYADDIDNFLQKHYFPSNDKYAPYFDGGLRSIASYFDENSLIIVDEPKNISEGIKTYEMSVQNEVGDLQDKQVIMPNSQSVYLTWHAVVAQLTAQSRVVSLSALSHQTPDFIPQEIFMLTSKTLHSFHGKMEFLFDDLAEYSKWHTTVVIVTGSPTKAENLKEEIVSHHLAADVQKEQVFSEGKINIMVGSIKKGFYIEAANFALISDTEVFMGRHKRKSSRPENTQKIRDYTDINPGDYVVHQTHGIGLYEGIVSLKIDKVKKDFLKIKYNGTECLYIPPDQLNMLYKYIGNTDKHIRLNKLGGADWTKTKLKVKKATKDLANYLIKLYAEREKAAGYSFSPDTPWQRQFEDTFMYDETDDQLQCIDEVKADMEKSRPMDRLLCGDVGYGKTEVALRAAFKAVMDSKQVAYLVPTTILAMQHYNTFCERMKDFPVKVEMLSRFRTVKQQKDIIKRLKTGEIDIVIGTHRILQKDLQFKDLGLLIVDEEQRFGVEHKEKFKELKNGIDVLTLSATPIPRTLHMTMVNIRDMSVLADPPQMRYPVQTYVIEYDQNMILEAIKKEVARGGQVYYLFNRVAGIYRVAQRLQELLPDVRIAVGHGKMNQDTLEDIMMEMVEGEIDVLVCTTIIETGLDIPNVNTIIIEDADRMGLAQLYQLRGRVGRSNRRAYAYFTYRRDKVLTDIAEKRLVAIKEFTEFGSGFKIAMRDLEIRGAGNLLGAQQHGHIDAVGYDTYCKILKESIDEEQGIFVKPVIPTVMDVAVNAYIPNSYIKSNQLRVDAYKKIAAIETIEDRYEVEDEFIDRFGDIPKSVSVLMDIVLLKSDATQLGFSSIIQKDQIITFRFESDAIDPQIILALCRQYTSTMHLSAGLNPFFTLKLTDKESKDPLSHIKFLLQSMKELKNISN